MNFRNSVYKGVRWNTAATVVSTLVQVLKLVVLTRILQKSDFGIIAIATMIIGFTEIFSEIGLTVGIIHKQNITIKQYSSIYWMNVILSFMLFAILCLITPLLSLFYDQPVLNNLIPLLGLQIIFNAFGKMYQTIKTKNMEFDFISKITIITALLGFGATWLLALFGLGVYSLAIGQLVMIGSRQAVYVIKGSKQQQVLFYLNIKEISDFLRIGVYRLGSQILDFASSKVDVFLIGRFFGMDDLGIYTLAKELITRPYGIINTLINTVAASAFAQLQSNMNKVCEYFKIVINTICIISIPIYVVIFVFADIIVTCMYGPSFAKVALLLRILAFVGIEGAISSQASILQVALGRTDVGFKWTIYRVVLTVTSIFVASLFDIEAVAYGQLLIALISIVLYWRIVVYPISQIRLKEYFKSFENPLEISILFGVPYFILVTIFDSLILHIGLLALYLLSIASYYYFNKSKIALLAKVMNKH